MNARSQGQPAAAAPESKFLVFAAALTIALAWLTLFLAFYPLPPRGDLAPHRAVGEILAREALAARDNVGRVFVITRELEMFDVPAAKAQVDAFRGALKKARVPIAHTQIIKVDPLRVTGVPPGDFFELLRRAAQNDVIVSFHGPPVLDAAQIAKLGDKRPRVLAVCSGAMPIQVDLKKIFALGLLRAAVISRPVPAAKAAGSGTQGEFDRLFQMVTPAHLAELPSPSAARL